MKYPFLDLGAVNAPYIDDIKVAVSRVVDSGRYIGGDEIDKFEATLSRMTHTPYAIGVSNGLDALRLILRAYIELGRLKPGDEVIVPANTYVASFLAITDNALTPVPIDVDPVTMNLDTTLLEQYISPRTRAVMPVHLYGRVAWDSLTADTARSHGLIVIEDNAQAIGAQSAVPGLFGTHSTGSLGHAAAFSFYPTKNIGAMGDAGAVTTHDPELAATVRALANYGSDRRYHNIYAGLNCRMDPIQAAVLNVKLPHVDKENAARFARAACYRNEISHPLVVPPVITEHVSDCVWHQYVIRVKGGHRDALQRHLADNGVGTDIHYPTPPHMQPCYAHLTHNPLPIAETLAKEILSLPISPATTVKQASEIAGIINDFPTA